MSTRIAALMRQNVVGLIAVFIALAGTAYADNEWTGANIQNGTLESIDYKNDDIKSVDVQDATLKANDVAANAIPSDDECGQFLICFSSTKIADRAVGASEISPGAVGSSEVAPNSLTGSDIDESQLDVSAIPTPAGFSFSDGDTGEICNVGCTEGTLTDLPAGTYLVLANITIRQHDLDEEVLFASCQLSSANGDFGFAQTLLRGDTSGTPISTAAATLAIQGVRTLPSGGNVSVNCHDGDVGNADGANLRITAARLGTLNGRAG
jgi:hypothetical protein